MRVERINVTPKVVEVLVRIPAEEPLRTSAYPELPRLALELLPGLAKHDCRNADGRRFVVELGDTEVAHLFEHLTLELMALAGSPRTTTANTSWDFRRDGRGAFHVEIAYDNDLVCLGAIRLAERVARYLLTEAEPPDIAAEVARLRELRSG